MKKNVCVSLKYFKFMEGTARIRSWNFGSRNWGAVK